MVGRALAGSLVLAILTAFPVASSAARTAPKAASAAAGGTCVGTASIPAPVNGIVNMAVKGEGASTGVGAATKCTVTISGGIRRTTDSTSPLFWSTVASAGVTTVTNGAFSATVNTLEFQGTLLGQLGAANSPGRVASGVASWSIDCTITFPPFTLHCTIYVGVPALAATGSAPDSTCVGTSSMPASVVGKVAMTIKGSSASSSTADPITSCIISVDGLEHSHETIANAGDVVAAGVATVSKGIFTVPLSVPGFTGKLSGLISTTSAAGATGTGMSGIASWSIDCEWSYPPLSLHCTIYIGSA
jgi:hypothetical protein